MLKIQVKNPKQSTQQNAIWVVERLYSIGSGPKDNLRLMDDSVSPQHASLITLDNRLYLRDNNSTEGCYVNNERVNKKEVVPGDVVRVGDVEILIMDPRDSLTQEAVNDLDSYWSLVACGSFLTGQKFYVQSSPCIVGRGTQCHIILPSTHISRQHAEISILNGKLKVRDLASSNGTFINGKPISHESYAKRGDEIRFDRYQFQVAGPEKDSNITMVRGPYIPTNDPPTPTYSTAEKRWQTKPTSPGNRIIEDNIKSNKTRKVLTGITLTLMVGVFVYLVYGILKG